MRMAGKIFKSWKRGFITLAFLVYGPAVFSESVYPCVKTGKAPELDGKILSWDGFMTDDCWKNAVWGESFLIPAGTRKAMEQTRFALAHDAEYLYLAAVCYFKSAKSVDVRIDRDQPWENECLELFVEPNGGTVRHLLFDAGGRNVILADGDRKELSAEGGEAVVRRNADSWELEAKIPLRLFGNEAGFLKSGGRFNVARERRAAGMSNPSLSTWAWLPETKFMSPEHFIPLVFRAGKGGLSDEKMSAPLPAEAVKSKTETSSHGFILDMAEDKSQFRGARGITESAGEPFASDFIPLANPIAGKPLNALFIIENTARDVFELTERMQFGNVDYILFGTPYGVGNNRQPFAYHAEKVVDNLTGHGRKYDVIFVSCEINNQPLFDCIEKQVREGTGLVILSPRLSGGKDLLQKDFLLPPLQRMDALRDDPVLCNWSFEGLANTEADPESLSRMDGKIIGGVGFGTYGKGRIFHIGDCKRWSEGVIPYPLYDYGFYDKQVFPSWWEQVFSLVMKGLWWAGNRETGQFLGKCVRNGANIEIPILRTAPVGLDIRAWWDNRNFKIPPSTVKVPAGARKAEIPIPAELQNSLGVNGASLCHFALKEAKTGKTLDWGDLVISNPATASLLSACLDREFYRPGEKPVLKLRTSGTAENLRVETEVRDSFDRLVSRTSSALTMPETTLRLDTDRALSDRLTVRVLLLDRDGRIQDNRLLRFFLPEKNPLLTCEDFSLLLLASPIHYRGYQAPALTRLMEDTGIRATFPEQWEAVYPGDRESIFYEADSHGAKPPHQRAVCFNRDQKLVENAVARFIEGTARKLRFGMPGVTMADEGGISGCAGGYGVNGSDPAFDYCYCPACVEAFRKYAASRYGSLGAANSQWGTSFKSWADVKPEPLEVIRKRTDKNYALWVDFKFFMEKCYLDRFKIIKGEILKKFPCASVGLTNPDFLGQRTLLSGENYPAWAEAETLSLKYYGPTDSVGYGSFQSPGVLRSSWWGYGSDLPMVRTEPWWAAFNKIRLYTWWYLSGDAGISTPTWSTNNLYAPFFSHTPRSLELKKTAEDLIGGIGKIALDAPYSVRDTALLYSQPSMYVAGVERKDNSYYFRSEANWRNLLMSDGFPFDYLDAEHLTAKITGYKVVILPYSIALSPETQNALLDFAKSGGTVIADVRPGTFDGHGSPLNGKGKLWSFLEKKQMEESSCKGGKFRVRRLGSGRIVLLGSVPAFSDRNAEVVAELLNEAKVRRFAWLTGSLKNKYDLYPFEKENGRYLGIVGSNLCEQTRSPQVISGTDPDRATVHLDGNYHVYNVRTHQYLGLTDSFPALLRPDHPEFFAMLPSRTGGFEADVKYDKSTHSFICSGKLRGALADDRLISVSVISPEGKSSLPYSRKIWTRQGTFDFSLPLALDDPPGSWKIGFTDVVGGEKVNRAIELKR